LLRSSLVRRWHRLQSFEGGLLEGLAVVGVGNLDQSPGALTQRFAEEIGNAELRADLVLLVVGDAALLHEVNDAASEHLAVDSEVFVQLSENCVGDVSDAHLQGRAVFHEILSDPLADGFFLRTHLAVCRR
jgi:hypothetical protein